MSAPVEHQLPLAAFTALMKKMRDEQLRKDIKEEPKEIQEEQVDEKEEFPSVEVTCGTLVGRLYPHLFMCPGIHVPCIMFQNSLCSPKEFTVLACKDKQKDWKGSIRVKGRTLRHLMDINQLDFASHDIYCSHKCLSRSRNNDLTEALRAFTSHHLVQHNSRKKMQMTFPAAQSPMGFTAFIPPNPNPQFLQSLMVTDPVRFLAELHHLEILPQVVELLANALKSAHTEDPLPTNMLHSFAPALFQALGTFNLHSEVFELIHQKQSEHMPTLPRAAVSIKVGAPIHPADLSASPQMPVKPLSIKEEMIFE